MVIVSSKELTALARAPYSLVRRAPMGLVQTATTLSELREFER